MKIINQNDTPQHHISTDSNDTSRANCALQIYEGNFTKELILDPSYSSDTIYDYLEDNIPLTNPTEIKNSVDFCQVDNHEQEPMKIYTDTKDPIRFNPQQNTDDNRNIKYEKRNGETFTRSYMMNMLRNAELIASTNRDKLPWPGGDWEGSNDYDQESLLEKRLSPQKRLQRIFALHYL